MSDDDLNWIFPDAVSLTDKALRLVELGADMVILTRGENGAHAFFGTDQQVNVPAQKVKVIDTIGAGDTFNSGLLASLAQQNLLAKSTLREVSQEQINPCARICRQSCRDYSVSQRRKPALGRGRFNDPDRKPLIKGPKSAMTPMKLHF